MRSDSRKRLHMGVGGSAALEAACPPAAAASQLEQSPRSWWRKYPARYFAALSAILIAPLTYATIAFYLQVTGGDPDGVLKPALMLGLSQNTQHLFALSMLFDVLGCYALVLFVGGFLWNRLRQTSNGLDEIAILALGLFATLGIAGAALFASTLPVLARLHADATTRAAAEVAWLALAAGVERGLWLFEYLPFAVWCFLTAPRLRAAGARHGWLLTIIGTAWALYFVGGVLELTGAASPNLSDLVEAPALFGLAVTPVWALLNGLALLRPEASPNVSAQ